VKCRESSNNNFCGLVQLKEIYNPSMMYGKNYVYRLGFSQSMVNNLDEKVKNI